MYETLSKRVEGIVRQAHQIARAYEQEYVGTEHILLAISNNGDSLGARILQQRGATPEKIKAEVDKLVQLSMEETWVFGRLPGTPHFKNVIAGAIEAARELSSKEVCTQHLLIALLKEKGSVAYNALKNLGIDIHAVREDLTRMAPAD